MPRYFTVKDLLQAHSIEDKNVYDKAENHHSSISLIETFQILLEKNLKDTQILCSIIELDECNLYFLKSMIEILKQNEILHEDILKKILEFTPSEKLFRACVKLDSLGILTTETLAKIMIDDIDNKVLELTKPFPIKNTYLYIKATYGSSMKWGLGCGLGFGGGYYILASLKVLAIGILNSHPLIGAAVIASSILILFLLSKACSEYFPQKKPSP